MQVPHAFKGLSQAVRSLFEHLQYLLHSIHGLLPKSSSHGQGLTRRIPHLSSFLMFLSDVP